MASGTSKNALKTFAQLLLEHRKNELPYLLVVSYRKAKYHLPFRMKERYSPQFKQVGPTSLSLCLFSSSLLVFLLALECRGEVSGEMKGDDGVKDLPVLG